MSLCIGNYNFFCQFRGRMKPTIPTYERKIALLLNTFYRFSFTIFKYITIKSAPLTKNILINDFKI